MVSTGPPKPRISRETRLLLATVLLSLTALWSLARIRFPERPATLNPVPPLLTQLAPRPVFDDLATALLELEPEVLPALLVLDVHDASSASTRNPGGDAVPALRLRDDLVVALVHAAPAAQIAGATIVARDRASGLGVIRVATSAAPAFKIWTPQRVQYPRYVIVSDVSHAGVSLRPVFLGPLRPVDSPVWSTSVWAVPSHANVPAGAFVFTTTGALAGLAAREADGSVIVPAASVIAAAERLLAEPRKESGTLGVDVQALTPQITAATGATSGVAVTWVDPRGPAAAMLVATDIIEAIDDEQIATLEHFRARMARLTADETIVLRVRRGGRSEKVQVRTVQPSALAASPKLGLTMRSTSGMGAEVTRVAEGSIAAAAGIRIGDVITRIGEIPIPTPTQVNTAFSAQSSDRVLLAAVTRGEEHMIVALGKR